MSRQTGVDVLRGKRYLARLYGDDSPMGLYAEYGPRGGVRQNTIMTEQDAEAANKHSDWLRSLSEPPSPNPFSNPVTWTLVHVIDPSEYPEADEWPGPRD